MPLTLWIALVFTAFAAQAADYNIMVIDSSFAPIKISSGEIGQGECLWIDEADGPAPEKGECYDRAVWQDLQKADRQTLLGYLDSLGPRRESAAAKYWQVQLQGRKDLALSIKRNIQRLTHGSRSVWLLDKASGGLAKPLLVRSISTQVGRSADTAAGSSKNTCSLGVRSDNELNEFLQKKKLQAYQERIARALEKNPSIKVISISLGYKQSWIKEDHPNCNDRQVAREYLVLLASWRNLINRFPDRLFVTAIGNEAEDFSQAGFRKNDLWGALADADNLVTVGSLDNAGRRAKFSNFGLTKMLWEKGTDIPIDYPVPGDVDGHSTFAHGTSSSAPLAAGRILMLQKEKKTLAEAVAQARAERRPRRWDFNAYVEACKTHDQHCIQAVKGLLADGRLWGQLQSWYRQINTDWHPAALEIRFSSRLKKEGRQLIERRGQWMIPVIELSPSDPYEILITLNHELYHVTSLENHIAALQDSRKINDCMTKYQLLRLQDETAAFAQEIAFWRAAPPWFKDHFKDKKIPSKLIGKETTYEEYYRQLAERMKQDKNYVVKRYIELGEVSACASEAIARHSH